MSTTDPKVLHFYSKTALTKAIVEGHNIRFLCGQTSKPWNLLTKDGKPVQDNPEMGICVKCLGAWERHYGKAYRVTPEPAENTLPSVGERGLAPAGGGEEL